MKAICVLHNYLIDELPASKCPSTLADTGLSTIDNGLWREYISVPLQQAKMRNSRDNNSLVEAKVVREKLKHFFNNEGAVTWQEAYI